MPKSNKQRRAELVARRKRIKQTRREYFLTDREKKAVDEFIKYTLRAG